MLDTDKLARSNARKMQAVADHEDEPTMTEVFHVNVTKRTVPDDSDDFSKDPEFIKSLSGLSPTFKRGVSRTINKVFSGAEGTGTKAVEMDDISGYNIFRVVFPPYNLEYLAQIYERSTAHAAAVDAKVSNIVALGYDFQPSPKYQFKIDDAKKQADKDKLDRKVKIAKQAMFDWLDACNSEDAFTETLRKVWVDYETTGNGYIEVGRTAATGIPMYIGHIPSKTMRIRKDRDGFVQIVGKRAVFFRNFGDTKTADQIGTDRRPNEVIHLKKYSPTNSYYGIPDIVSALGAVAGSEFAQRYNLDYFENKAVPRYIVVVKGATLSQNSKTELAEFFETGLKGKNHRSLIVPLPADEGDRKTSFEMKAVEAGKQDSSFSDYDKTNDDKILMAHRVPRTKVSVSGDSASLAIAADADKTFKEAVCRPEQDVLEWKLNKIIKAKTDIFLIGLNELSLTDEKTQNEIDDTNLKNQTLLPNEVRARRGQGPIPGGATPFEMHPQQAADTAATANQTRSRDATRQANAPDNNGGARQPKGEGRVTP